MPFGDLLTTIRSQGGAGGPTIASIYDLWLPELVRDKLVSPAPDAISAEVKAEWPAGVASAATVGGKVYGIPNEINAYALNYNKALFAEAGIASAPKTWDELKDAAAKLTKKEGGKVTQQGLGIINSWAAGVVHPFASLLVSNGGDLVIDGKPALDSKAAGETFALYEDMVKQGYTDPAMGTADANTTGPFLDNFVSGKTGMIIMANWWESALKAGMGDKFANIATAPIPVGPSGDKARSISYSWMTVVNAGASEAEQKAAWDFLAWLNGKDSGQNGASAMADILMSMGILPSRSSDVAAHQAQTRRRLPERLCRGPCRRQAVPGRARRAGILRGAAASDRVAPVRQDHGCRGADQRADRCSNRSSNAPQSDDVPAMRRMWPRAASARARWPSFTRSPFG